MSNHWGGELLNDALILAETQGFFEGHSSEKIRGLMIKLVELAVNRRDCNAYEILDEIGPRHGLCFCCLNAASKFSPDGYCPTCSAEWEADEDDDEESSGLIFLPSECSIPFDNLNPAQVEQKAYLQAQLRKMQPAAGQFLVARFSGPRHPKADVENLLFYNIGNDCFSSALKYGVQFEAISDPSSSQCFYTYQLDRSTKLDRPRSWKRTDRLAAVDEVKISAPNDRWAEQIWLTLRTARPLSEVAYQGPFGVTLSVRSAAGVDPKLGPEQLKKLLDGLVSAYQWHSQDKQLAEACERLSQRTGHPAQQLHELLCDSAGAVLGSPGELLRVYRSDVMWNPDDHLCVAGTVQWSQGTQPEWTLSGEIWSLKANPGWRTSS